MNSNNQVQPINPQFIQDPDEAQTSFEQLGGRITAFSPFGSDPLLNHPVLSQRRNSMFHQQYPNFNAFFSRAANGDFTLFKAGLIHFINSSKYFQSLI